jgi:hypothetical protein
MHSRREVKQGVAVQVGFVIEKLGRGLGVGSRSMVVVGRREQGKG